MTDTERVLLALSEGPADRQVIAARAEMLPRAVGNALSKLVTRGRVANIGGKQGGMSICTAVYQIAGFFQLVDSVCLHCGEKYTRIFTYKVSGTVMQNYRGTCSAPCREARRKHVDKIGTRYKRKVPQKQVCRHVAQANLAHIPAGDLIDISIKRIDRTQCFQPGPFADNQCARYSQCLNESFTACAGYTVPESVFPGPRGCNHAITTTVGTI
jgi:hypothetical protein